MKTYWKCKKQGFAAVAVLGLCVFVAACSDMFDNVKKFADKEIVYADKLDGIVRTQVGYERVEIDLLNANLLPPGRIPSSELNMGKAKKTVIECIDFTEPEHRRVIDSVCSWVNVTRLTQLKNYSLTIYTEDEFGNRSLPFKTEVKPFTSENLNALSLPTPSITELGEDVEIKWQTAISSKVYRFFGCTFEYTNKNGEKITGETIEGDTPSFLVENIEKGADVPVTLTCRILPALMGDDGVYTSIIDTLDWKPKVILHVSK